MCGFSNRVPKYTPPKIAPAPKEVAPMVNPEENATDSTGIPANSASSRKKLRIDLASNTGTGLNAPAG